MMWNLFKKKVVGMPEKETSLVVFYKVTERKPGKDGFFPEYNGLFQYTFSASCPFKCSELQGAIKDLVISQKPSLERKNLVFVSINNVLTYSND